MNKNPIKYKLSNALWKYSDATRNSVIGQGTLVDRAYEIQNSIGHGTNQLQQLQRIDNE